jgi:endonuclease YncB( thermonuclease family)
MKSKALMNLLPILVILGICGFGAYQQWQRIQLSRPAYDSSSSPEQPVGVIAEANQIQIPQTERWQVVRVSDGDTIVVRKGIRQERIRLCGIDAPESTQPLGAQSKAYLQRLLGQGNNQVGIVPVERDRYGRLVAEVFILETEEKFVQQEILATGMAYVYPKYVDGCWNGEAMKLAEDIAKENHAGVWASSHQTPWDYRQSN